MHYFADPQDGDTSPNLPVGRDSARPLWSSASTAAGWPSWTPPAGRPSGRDDSLVPQPGEQIQERTGVGWYSWKPARRLLVMSVTTSISARGPGRYARPSSLPRSVRRGRALPRSRPSRPRLRQLWLERRRAARVRGGLNPEVGREPRPEPAPAENVAVDDVERLVAAGLGGRGPFQVPGEDAGIGHVGQPVPLLGGAGETKGRPVSRQIVAYTARVTPMFMALPSA